MLLRNIFILLLAIVLTSCGPGKTSHFRGKVEYRYTYESDQLDADSLALEKPHTGIMIFENNNYQSIFMGKDTQNYVYLGDWGICYGFTGTGDDPDCEDYKQPTDSILNYKVYDTIEKVLGHECMILEFQSKYFWNRYYVSKKARLHPEGFKNHKAYNWSFYGEQTNGGLILKMEHRFKNYIMKGLAVVVKEFPADSRQIDVEKARSHCRPGKPAK